jgi:hypothetical protein
MASAGRIRKEIEVSQIVLFAVLVVGLQFTVKFEIGSCSRFGGSVGSKARLP